MQPIIINVCSTWKLFYNSAVICVSEQNKTIKYIINKQLTYFSYNLRGWMLRVNLSIGCLLAFILAWDWMWSEPCVNCKCFWLSQCCHRGKVKLQLFFYNDWTVSWCFQLIVLAIFLSLICSINLSLSFFLSIQISLVFPFISQSFMWPCEDFEVLPCPSLDLSVILTLSFIIFIFFNQLKFFKGYFLMLWY